VFRQTGPNAAESADGFTVRRVSRNTIEYAEGNRKTLIEVEPGDGLAIYRQSLERWESPRTDEPLDNLKKAEIIHRVCAAMDFLGIRYVLE
jgi:hypothetical protein